MNKTNDSTLDLHGHVALKITQMFVSFRISYNLDENVFSVTIMLNKACLLCVTQLRRQEEEVWVA